MPSEQEIIEAGRAALVALIPEAIETAATVMRRPGRNAQAQIAIVKTILDRAGLPAVAETKIGDHKITVEYTIAEELRAARNARLAAVPKVIDSK